MSTELIHFLTVPPSREVAEQGLHADLRAWFASTYGNPTLAQHFAWPAILGRHNLLVSSPTGSGKTLAAFLPILSELVSESNAGLCCLYIAPLKALCRDVAVNLKKAWRSIQRAGYFAGAELRVGMRTGDTTQRVRQRYLRHPPSILVSTPESLAQMLAHPPTHRMLATIRVVLVDEIHSLVGNKRGADVALSLERLECLTGSRAPIQRIGLSATCAPLAAVAQFLVGASRSCLISHTPDATLKQFEIEPLFENLEYSAGWLEVLLDRLERETSENATTMVFANTRNLAERLTWALRRRYPERAEAIAIHHSAISAARRRAVERRLKHRRIWIIVTSTSLELGIDIGSVDQVVFVHPPGGVVRLLQRVGRSGHQPDEPRRGLLLTGSASELIEAVVTASSGRDGQIDAIRPIEAPLDVLCQQLVGLAMTGRWSADEAFTLVRRATPYRALSRETFDDCLNYLTGRRCDGSNWLPSRLAWNFNEFTIIDDQTAKLLRRNLGTILTEDACAIRLREAATDFEAPTRSVGEVDQTYAERLNPGDRFILDGRCLEVKSRDEAEMVVEEVFGRPLAPRWPGAGVPMPNELARRIFLFRAQAADVLRDGAPALLAWFEETYHLGSAASQPLVELLERQETLSEVPTHRDLLVECVTMQSCHEYFVHTPLPRSANESIARVLLDRVLRDRGVKSLAMAVDLGIHAIVPTDTPLSANDWRNLLSAAGFAEAWLTHLRSSELLASAFGRVAQTGLMVLRNPQGRKRKVGGNDWAERRLFEQLRDTAPDFVLLCQAEAEASSSLCDFAEALAFVERLTSLPIRVRHLSQPSPFCEAMLMSGFAPTAITATS